MSQRQRDDIVLLAHIREQHRLSLKSYGRPRMTEELQELGLKVGHRRIGRLMRENGIKIIRTQKYKVMTYSDHTFNIAPNLLVFELACCDWIERRENVIALGTSGTGKTHVDLAAEANTEAAVTCLQTVTASTMSLVRCA
jgi:transposase InsO family protein